ncbi:L-arabinose transport system permease protein AraH [Sodalis praecaptivus]|nr:L-arabinose transport system permease protein AraH [Sodalis praecaptivus]
MSTVTYTPAKAPKSRSISRIWDNYGMLVVFAALFVACALFVPNFASFINMKGVDLSAAPSCSARHPRQLHQVRSR